MTAGLRVAETAQALVGTPFRLHGRDPATGLDCVGLVAAALIGAGISVTAPSGYCLRNREIGGYLVFAEASGLVPATVCLLPGDVLLTAPGPWQHHLLVAGSSNHFIHAHAALGRVVAMPGPLPWPVLRHWRLFVKD